MSEVTQCVSTQTETKDEKEEQLNLNWFQDLWQLLRREEGQDLAEYALIVGIVAAGTVTLLQTVAAPLLVLINKATTALTSA